MVCMLFDGFHLSCSGVFKIIYQWKPSARYRSLRMITVLIWKKACINLFITYFNIELKRTKLTSHTDTKLMDMSDHIFYKRVSFCFWNANKSFLDGRRHFPNDNWQLAGSNVMGLKRGLISCYQSFAPISAHGLISLWQFRCLRIGKIDVITYKYVIDMIIYTNPIQL